MKTCPNCKTTYPATARHCTNHGCENTSILADTMTTEQKRKVIEVMEKEIRIEDGWKRMEKEDEKRCAASPDLAIAARASIHRKKAKEYDAKIKNLQECLVALRRELQI